MQSCPQNNTHHVAFLRALYLDHYFSLNDFPKCLRHTTPGMFADDTYITTAHEDISTIECSLNSDLIAVHNWLKTNKLSCNTSKTSYMTIGSRQNLANAKFMNLELDNRPIEHKSSTKLLGVHIDEMLSLDNQIKHTSRPQWTN